MQPFYAPSQQPSDVRQLAIGPYNISDASDCFVIAEIGHNHQGNVDLCMQLFDAAKASGAHAVKLQKRDNKTLFTQAFYHSAYHSENAYGPTYGQHREALEFDKAQYQTLKTYAEALGLVFFATAFDVASADFLAALDMPAYKIASGDLTNTPLLKHVALLGKPLVISTGGATMAEVTMAIDTILPLNAQLAVLQCTTTYPTDFLDMNMRVITSFRDAFPEVVVGLSSHDSGIAMATASYLLGARIVEKHFTLNRAMKGTDHAFSLEPTGMRKLVRDLQRLRLALGSADKICLPVEAAARAKMGKSMVAKTALLQGHILTANDLAFKSPGGGMPPYQADSLLGKALCRSVALDEVLTLAHVEAVAGEASCATAPTMALV
jgi:sialic acid synthase